MAIWRVAQNRSSSMGGWCRWPGFWISCGSPMPPPTPTPGVTRWPIGLCSTCNLATRHGQLDLCFAPAGFPRCYADLERRATDRPAAETTIVVSVAALEDVHESKRQADRPKDREYRARVGEYDPS